MSHRAELVGTKAMLYIFLFIISSGSHNTAISLLPSSLITGYDFPVFVFVSFITSRL